MEAYCDLIGGCLHIGEDSRLVGRSGDGQRAQKNLWNGKPDNGAFVQAENLSRDHEIFRFSITFVKIGQIGTDIFCAGDIVRPNISRIFDGMNDDLGAMSGVKFIARETNRLVSDNPEGRRKAGDEEGRDGGHKSIVSVSLPHNPENEEWAEMVLGTFFYVCVVVWGAYLIVGGEEE